MSTDLCQKIQNILQKGIVIPASPLALDGHRHFDRRRQRALMRYYLDAGAGGIAVGMHFTEFEIRRPDIGLYEPVLRICAETVDDHTRATGQVAAKITGLNGKTLESVAQAETARELGFHLGVVSLAGWRDATADEMIEHVHRLAGTIPVFGFYLAPELGGVPLTYPFWREFLEIDNVHGIKIASFDPYATLDVMRAVADSGRSEDIVLYTGNDNSIVHDLITPFRFVVNGQPRIIRFRGGLLGQWACWTRRAVELLDRLHAVTDSDEDMLPREILTLAASITDANGAIFDAANGYVGAIPGVKEILRRQGLLESTLTLNPKETLSPGQKGQIDRVCIAYPELNDDEFVSANLEKWMA